MGLVSILGWILFQPAFFLIGIVVLMIHTHAGEAPRVQEALAEVEAMREGGLDPFLLAAILMSTTVAAPLVEEFVFRGILHGALRARIGPGPAIAISSAAFTIVHWPPGVWPQIFLLGVFLAWAYERSGSLWAPIAIHFANNAFVLAITIGGILLGGGNGG